MASKITLQPNPSFKHTVLLPLAGKAEPEALELTFKHKTRSQLQEIFTNGFTPLTGEGEDGDTKFFMDFVSGWDIDADFTVENVTAFLENYSGAGQFIWFEYINEIGKARVGN